jgi:hypothetical protein
MIMRLMLGLIALIALTAASHARSLSYVCDGTISHYPLMAYMAITAKGEDVCIFVTRSPEGKKILQVCPKGTQCSVEAEVNNTGSANEIYKVTSVHRTGTPALDARAKKDKEDADRRRWAAILPYAERTTNCIVDHVIDASQDAVDDALEKLCARERDALRAEYAKRFGPGGNYLLNDYYTNLPRVVEERAKQKWEWCEKHGNPMPACQHE